MASTRNQKHAPFSAAKLLGEIGPIKRFDSDAQRARHAELAPALPGDAAAVLVSR